MAETFQGTLKFLNEQLQQWEQQLAAVDFKLMESFNSLPVQDIIYSFAIAFGSHLNQLAPDARGKAIENFPRALQHKYNSETVSVLRKLLAERDVKARRCEAITLAIMCLSKLDYRSIWSGLHQATQNAMLTNGAA